MIKTDIYVGLNDQETKEQRFETAKYITVLKDVCKSYKVPFSFNVSEGGYIHESGEYVQETSLVLTLIDVDDSTVAEIAKDLCAFFNQESVLITEDLVRSFYVNQSS